MLWATQLNLVCCFVSAAAAHSGVYVMRDLAWPPQAFSERLRDPRSPSSERCVGWRAY